MLRRFAPAAVAVALLFAVAPAQAPATPIPSRSDPVEILCRDADALLDSLPSNVAVLLRRVLYATCDLVNS